ncbi:MAG: threonine synthase, partial [Myxococcales bacterium]|nr:threonine synthase [Myxococcales bacterium]
AVDALRRYDGVVEQATETEIMEECAAADRTGLFNCPHTGVALVALRKLQKRGLVRAGDQVVVISTAHGLKFVDSKLAYHAMELEGIVSAHPNPPIELPADYQQVRDRMLGEIDRRFAGGAGRKGA